MNLYKKSLRRLANGLMLVATIELVMYIFVLVIGKTTKVEVVAETIEASINPVNDLLQIGILFAAGLIVRLFYHREHVYKPLLIALTVLLVALIICTLLDSNFVAYDMLVITPHLMIYMVIYTLKQIRRNEKKWRRVSHLKPIELDLKLEDRGRWFNSLIIGPHLELNPEISSLVDRFLVTQKTVAPMRIVIHGVGDLSEPMRETMRDIFREHYEDEMRRVGRYLEARYIRMIALLCVSVIGLELWVGMDPENTFSSMRMVLSNFAAFSMWQVGSTYLERSEGQQEMLQITTAKNAEIIFM